MTLPTILIVTAILLILAAIARRYTPEAIQKRVEKWVIDSEKLESGR